MKNSEILFDVIGEVDESLLPDFYAIKKKRDRYRFRLLGAAVAAAVLTVAVSLPQLMEGGVKPAKPESSETQKVDLHTAVISDEDREAFTLAAAVYPQMPRYAAGNDKADRQEWEKVLEILRDQPEGYDDGVDYFFFNSAPVLLQDAGSGNAVYSPLGLYMALSMSAEMTDGDSRQQILDVLGQKDIDTLRSNAKSVWNANYMDDGVSECLLANSIWLNDNAEYHQDTVDSVAENYYASVYSGDPMSDEYNIMLHDWISEQTDGLLDEYIDDINMDHDMLATLASTVNYCGEWESTFKPEDTHTDVFHSPTGDVQCDFMHDVKKVVYYNGLSFTAVELPMKNNGHIKLIRPSIGTSPEMLLNEDGVRQFMLDDGGYLYKRETDVFLDIPKFDISSSLDLRDSLPKLGISDIFDHERSDFTPLTDKDNIYISKAEQDTRVIIDEMGCKAASATMMTACMNGYPYSTTDFSLDKPFIFEIESETGLPLFAGIVNVPY